MYVAIAAALLIAVVVAVGLMSGGSNVLDPQRSSPRDDVEITGCSVSSALSWPEVTLRITNNSSKTSDYRVNVEFVDGNDVRIAEGVAVISNLASGQVANESATGFTEASGQVVCRITDVTRFAS